MKILLDACCSRDMQNWLVDQGFDAETMCDPTIPDDQVIELARKENRLLITLDRGFNQRNFEEGSKAYKNVLLIYTNGSPQIHKQALEILKVIFSTDSENLEGYFSVYKGGRLKCGI